MQVAGALGHTDVPLLRIDRPSQRALRGDRIDEQSAAVNAYLRGHRVKLQVDYTHFHAEHMATGLDALGAPNAAPRARRHSARILISPVYSVTGRGAEGRQLSHCALWWYTFGPGDSG